jgi:hypothetical protein
MIGKQFDPNSLSSIAPGDNPWAKDNQTPQWPSDDEMRKIQEQSSEGPGGMTGHAQDPGYWKTSQAPFPPQPQQNGPQPVPGQPPRPMRDLMPSGSGQAGTPGFDAPRMPSFDQMIQPGWQAPDWMRGDPSQAITEIPQGNRGSGQPINQPTGRRAPIYQFGRSQQASRQQNMLRALLAQMTGR